MLDNEEACARFNRFNAHDYSIKRGEPLFIYVLTTHYIFLIVSGQPDSINREKQEAFIKGVRNHWNSTGNNT